MVKPVEIADVPITTLTMKGAGHDTHSLRRLGEEMVERLAEVPQVSRAEVIGGEPRTIRLNLDPERLQGYRLSPLEIQRAIQGANVSLPAGELTTKDQIIRIETASAISRPEQLNELVVGVFEDHPIFLKDLVTIEDAPAEVANYVRHGWGPARHFEQRATVDRASLADLSANEAGNAEPLQPVVTIAVSTQKGANAVIVASSIIEAANSLRCDVLPSDVELIVTRNYGHTANEKVNELVEVLGVAIAIVIALLTLSLGWREAFIVAVAVPVVFGLTLAVNLLFGYTINRVTLFALILSLGLLVDDPINDVENIARHFKERKKATRRIVQEAVAEIRPPLISATLAVTLKMLPFDNKNEFLLVLDLAEGTSLERTNAVVAEFELVLNTVPEVTDFTSYVGIPGPIDFNGLAATTICGSRPSGGNPCQPCR